MNRRDFLNRCADAAGGFALASCGAAGAGVLLSNQFLKIRMGAKKPNIVLIFSDDQGYYDASCYPHPDGVNTPNIDKLSRDGVRLTDGYVSCPVCAPSRAGLLTGRYQQRFGIYSNFASKGIPLSELLLPQLLKQAGYATAVIGKWHLGQSPEYHPLKRGFDEFFGFLPGMHDYYDRQFPDRPVYRNFQPIEQDELEYLTWDFTREAVSFIERHRDEPFFLYLPYNAVHTPYQPPPDYTGDPDDNRQIHLAMLEALDDGIGQVLNALKHTGVDENTLLFFVSDNGGTGITMHYPPDVLTLNGSKTESYEGGIRVPFIVRWPGQLPAGTTCSEPIITLDILPTVCAAAGVELPKDRIYDGKNMLPVLRGETTEPLHAALFWHYPNKDTLEMWAIRQGNWKLVCYRDCGSTDTPTCELYDLQTDISETNDLAAQEPEKLAQLKDAWCDWRSRMASPWSDSGKLPDYLSNLYECKQH